jgi:mono/diheme cytochrome c family protein
MHYPLGDATRKRNGIVTRLIGLLQPAVWCAAAICFASSLAWAQQEVPKGDAEKGTKLYSRYCRGCHGEEGKGDGLVFMPHVPNLTKKGYIENLPDEYLLLAISKGGPGIGKSSYMPAWEGTLTAEQMYDIISYIRSLPSY